MSAEPTRLSDPCHHPDPEAFADALLAWHAQHGRHDLPWQHPRSPYRVWLSEIMLQQTQVTTVIPYFNTFIKQYPDVVDLANASQDDVLSLWSGLGYYARARNLHKTAQLIKNDYHAEFPDNFDALLSLPGIGASTANAILAQAFKQPAAILDGNVRRILARQICLPEPTTSTKAQKTLWSVAEQLTPNHSAANYTQAIMDLGATVCLRSKPLCLYCPVNHSCEAYQTNRVSEFPIKAAKKTKPKKNQDYYIYLMNEPNQALNDAKIYLVKRPDSGIWGGLWCFPETEIKAFSRYCNPRPLEHVKHEFTHYQLTLQPLLCNLPATNSSQQDQTMQEKPDRDSDYQLGQWFDIDDALKSGIPKPIRSIISQLK